MEVIQWTLIGRSKSNEARKAGRKEGRREVRFEGNFLGTLLGPPGGRKDFIMLSHGRDAGV